MLLALETANDHCSVALYDGKQVLALREDGRAREQTRLILPMIDSMLAEAGLSMPDIQLIAFSRGPGSFSGVRINAAVAQGLAWTHDIPVVPVSTLRALAQAAWRTAQHRSVVAVLDARMNELYCAAYQLDAGQLMQASSVEQLIPYADSSFPVDAAQAIVGSGSALFNPSLSLARYPELHASAVDVAQLGYADWQAGKAVTAAEALPVYLRDNAWKKIAEQQRGN